LKQGWAFAWRSLMAAELISLIPGHVGIGQLLNTSGEQLDFVGVWEAMITIFIIGVIVDAAFFGTMDRAIRRRYGLIDAAAS
jgi:NitT/TauT family transport system permease protein